MRLECILDAAAPELLEELVHLGVLRIFTERNSLPALLRDSLGGDAFIWTAGELCCYSLRSSVLCACILAFCETECVLGA